VNHDSRLRATSPARFTPDGRFLTAKRGLLSDSGITVNFHASAGLTNNGLHESARCGFRAADLDIRRWDVGPSLGQRVASWVRASLTSGRRY
jgi:hypothetical protein